MTKKIKTNPADDAIIHTAKTGEGAVRLTPELMREITEALDARKADIDVRFPKLVAAVDEETRLAIACWTVERICENWRLGGTYRYLLYDLMGFGPEAYGAMQWAGMLDIHNALPDRD